VERCLCLGWREVIDVSDQYADTSRIDVKGQVVIPIPLTDGALSNAVARRGIRLITAVEDRHHAPAADEGCESVQHLGCCAWVQKAP
jgi:hypothetical protein